MCWETRLGLRQQMIYSLPQSLEKIADMSEMMGAASSEGRGGPSRFAKDLSLLGLAPVMNRFSIVRWSSTRIGIMHGHKPCTDMRRWRSGQPPSRRYGSDSVVMDQETDSPPLPIDIRGDYRLASP